MANFRHPNINAPTTEGQLKQLKTYLYQLTNQLNYVVKSVESEEKENRYKVTIQGKSNGTGIDTGELSADDKALSTFNDVKNLIIKSADIVNAYYDVISKKLEGEYTALSRTEEGYDAFVQSTSQWRKETSENNTDYFESVQKISQYLGHELDENGKPVIPDGERLSEIRTDKFYIKTGWIYTAEDGHEVGGIELGQISDDGTNTDVAFAQFTTNELKFYNGSVKDKPLATFGIAGSKIPNPTIEGNIKVNDYILDNSDGIAFLWAGVD